MATTRLKRLERRTLILAGLAVLLIVALIIRPDRTRGASTSSLPELLPAFDRDAVAELSIVQQDPDDEDKKETIHLARRGDDWIMPDRYAHPVLPGTVDGLLDALEGARSRKVVDGTQRDL